MRLLKLSLENIGPFGQAELEFANSPDGPAPVAILTGENGTGKSIVLDAIRALFGPYYANLERRIVRGSGRFAIRADLDWGERPMHFELDESNGARDFARPGHSGLVTLPVMVAQRSAQPRWVVDFWRSALATDPHEIPALAKQDHGRVLSESLQGTYRNAAVTELICAFDYLRDSRNPAEKQAGEALYAVTQRIVEASLLDGGRLKHVERATFTPMIEQSGQVVPLANISSGNAYLVHHLISMLGKMYAVHVLGGTDIATLCQTPGLLLVDEAENHLHPKWQKRFVRTILDIFPNLQIIVTTHSPFIVSSWPSAKVFVCRYDRERGACTVTEEGQAFANKPADEILASDVFDGTPPFNEEISRLLEKRAQASLANDTTTRAEVEVELRKRNAEYFSYLEVEERLRALKKGAA